MRVNVAVIGQVCHVRVGCGGAGWADRPIGRLSLACSIMAPYARRMRLTPTRILALLSLVLVGSGAASIPSVAAAGVEAPSPDRASSETFVAARAALEHFSDSATTRSEAFAVVRVPPRRTEAIGEFPDPVGDVIFPRVISISWSWTLPAQG